MSSPRNVQDSELLDGARRLDRNALEALHDRYYPPVYRYIYFRLGEERSSAQISAQVFAHLLGSLQKKRGPKENLEAWLLAQAARLVDAHLHDPPERGSPSLAARLAGRQRQPQPGEQGSDRTGEFDFVQRALAGVSSDEQHYLALRFTTRHSLGEIADLLGKPVRAVRALQFRALSAFSALFGEPPQ